MLTVLCPDSVRWRTLLASCLRGKPFARRDVVYIKIFISFFGMIPKRCSLERLGVGPLMAMFFLGGGDLNGLAAPVIHRLMLISADTSHSVCISYMYLFVLATSALHNLTQAQDRLFVRAEWLRCKRCYLGARWMPSNLFGSHTLTLEVGLGGDFVSVFDSKKHYILFDICCFDDSFF